MPRPLRIAQVAPPLEPVPPSGYGGIERVVNELVRELDRRGHPVTTFAPGDSRVPGELVATVPRALWPAGQLSDPAPWFVATAEAVLARATDFDLIHSHLEWYSPLLGLASPVPVVTTFHGRLDVPWAPRLLRSAGRAVAISRAQAATHPDLPWSAVIHNGLTFPAPARSARGDDLAFVGRITPDKGILEAIEIARRTGRRLRIGAKSGKTPDERDFLERVFRPALAAAGSGVEWLGELSGPERDRLLAESWATLMPGAWPEPFGLVAIESLACGSPLIARPVGALPEIVRPGLDGFFGRDVDELAALVERVDELDREQIRRDVVARFSAARMVDGYEALYRSLVGEGAPSDRRPVAGTTSPGSRPARVPAPSLTVTVTRRPAATRPPGDAAGQATGARSPD